MDQVDIPSLALKRFKSGKGTQPSIVAVTSAFVGSALLLVLEPRPNFDLRVYCPEESGPELPITSSVGSEGCKVVLCLETALFGL